MKPAKDQEGYVFTRDPRLKVAALGFVSLDQVMEMATRITCEVLNIKASKTIVLDDPESYDGVLDVMTKHTKKMERPLFEGTHHLHLNNAETIAQCVYNFLVS